MMQDSGTNHMNKSTTDLAMDFTGERYVPELKGVIALEHIHRYLMACELAKDKVALDIASGEGYGSVMLSRVAHTVIGVDSSAEAIIHATQKYEKKNLNFVIGSCTEIPLPKASVDLVVSFETIEHHDQHEAMMAEIKRVLRPAGLLIMSSPEHYEYSVKLGLSNQYHVKELYRNEFEALIGSYFKNVAVYGQRVVYASGIFAESHASDYLGFSEEDGHIKRANGICNPVYLIAVATDAELPRSVSGIFEEPTNQSEIVRSLTNVVAERDAKVVSLNQAVAERDAQISQLQQWLGEDDTEINELRVDLDTKVSELASVRSTLQERDNQVSQLQEWLREDDAEINELRVELGTKVSELASLEDRLRDRDNRIEELESQINQLQQWLREDDALLNTLTQQIREKEASEEYFKNQMLDRESQIAHFKARTEGMESTIIHLQNELESAQQEAEQVRNQLLSRESELESIYRSISWRITTPVRFVGNKVRPGR